MSTSYTIINLGLSADEAGKVTWQDGTKPVYENWAPHEPTTDAKKPNTWCVRMKEGRDGQWYDQNCYVTGRYCACEFKENPGWCSGGDVGLLRAGKGRGEDFEHNSEYNDFFSIESTAV